MALHLPAEFENSMGARLGSTYPDFCKALGEATPVSIRVNPGKVAMPANNQVPWSNYGQYLDERPAFTLDPRIHAGAYYVQEASSMFLEQAIRQSVDLAQPLNVLDLCAAPGGKSTHILSLISKESLLVSNEVIRTRANILSENIQKWGHDNVVVTSSDPSQFQKLTGFFDLVVVDAPCSGEGLFRKDPDAAGEWSLKNVDTCSLRQRRILTDVWPSIKKGGVLIYSTCSYNEKENIENLEWLSKEHAVDFIRLSLDKDWGIETSARGSCIGYQLFPHKLRGEGFFLAAMRKNEDTVSMPPGSRVTIQVPGTSQEKEFSNWISNPGSQFFFQHHQTVRMIPRGKKNEFQYLLDHLNVVNAGTAVLEITRNKFIPDHALALSLRLHKEAFNRITLSKDQALSYLAKDQLNLPAGRTGFALIEFEGMGLGWVNVLENRINNLYPSAWRIRMQH